VSPCVRCERLSNKDDTGAFFYRNPRSCKNYGNYIVPVIFGVSGEKIATKFEAAKVCGQIYV